ncbi:hypothetical protein [Mycetocola reblochoni]|uniref:hypothetical protein n=1 Tax=Mycetocola reblochoni TaxID=331618 RepID=UPI00117F8829|nr:hypothetical protein [Mycetocola reblochoni]
MATTSEFNALVRASTLEDVGNDGLTDSERNAYAAKYRAVAGRRSITPEERRLMKAFRANRGAR